MSRIQKKGLILSVVSKKSSIQWIVFTKNFNSVGRKFNSVSYIFLKKKGLSLEKKVHFFESKFFKKVQVFETCKKEGSIL